MNKLITCLLFLLLSINTQAQNWQCVQPGVKHYFTNANYYLRGIRVDSVRSSGSNVLLYPFRSARGIDNNLDSNKRGSWLSKVITIAPDGTHYFDNYWGDTVVIKANANLNDSWILYNDNSTIYYNAQVTSVDTATVLGALDSVKTITITVYNGSNPLSTDLFNNAKFVLSKNNGFVRICDLYMFPLRKPNMTYYTDDFDYLTVVSKSDKVGWPATFTQSTALFNLVDFKNADSTDIYDYASGDVIEYKWHEHLVPSVSYDYIVEDSFAQKTTISANQVQYSAHEWKYTDITPTGPYPKPTPTNVNSMTTKNYTNSGKIIDTMLMPEEWGQGLRMFYNGLDTSLCYTSAYYRITNNLIDYQNNLAYLHKTDECGFSFAYKKGIGCIDFVVCTDGALHFSYWGEINYAKKNGIGCGSFIDLGVETIKQKLMVSTFPNPATDHIRIQLANDGRYDLSISDPLGRTLIKKQLVGKETAIEFPEIADGFYYLNITDNEGNKTNKKIVIQH